MLAVCDHLKPPDRSVQLETRQREQHGCGFGCDLVEVPIRERTLGGAEGAGHGDLFPPDIAVNQGATVRPQDSIKKDGLDQRNRRAPGILSG